MRRLAFALMATSLLLAGCQPGAPASAAKPSESQVAPPGEPVAGDPAAGKELFLAKGCVACHRAPTVPGATGTVGPNLAGLASRPKIAATIDNTPDNLKKWLRDPPANKPGTTMPNFGLSDDEATNLVAFLETLK